MGILGYQKQRKDLRSAMQTIRNHGTPVSGPYRRGNGTLIFSVADCVVTKDELLRLPRDGRLEANNLQEILGEIGKTPA